MLAPLLAVIALQYQMVVASDASLTANPNPLITPGPKLDPRALTVGDPRFLGWQVDGGTIYQRTCASGFTYSIQSPYFACCDTTLATCPFVSTCSGFYDAIFPGGSSAHCTNNCITGRLFASTEDTNPYTYLGCGSSDYWVVQSKDSSGLLNWTPGAPSVVTQTVKATDHSSSSGEASPSATAKSGPSSSGASSASQSTSAPLPAPSNKSNNAPIIGGAIGGAAVFLGLVALGLFLFFRRRKNSNLPIQPPPMAAAPVPQVPYPPAQYGPAEMGGTSVINPGSPPPPWDGYGGQAPQGGYFAPGQKPPSQPYQYAPVPKEAPQESSPHQYPQGMAEVQGVSATHAAELQ